MHTFLVTVCAVGVAMGAPSTYTILPGGRYLTPEMMASLQLPLPLDPSSKLEELAPLTNIVIPRIPEARPLIIEPMPKIEYENPEEPIKIEEGAPEAEKIYRTITFRQGPDFQSYWTNAQAYWANLQSQWQEWISNIQNNGVVAIFNPSSNSIRLVQNGRSIPFVLQK